MPSSSFRIPKGTQKFCDMEEKFSLLNISLQKQEEKRKICKYRALLEYQNCQHFRKSDDQCEKLKIKFFDRCDNMFTLYYASKTD